MKVGHRERREVVANLLIGLCVLTATAFLLGLAGERFWLFDLFSHARLHYSVALLASGVALLALHRVRSAAAVLAAGLLILITIVAYAGWRGPSVHAATDTLRFVTYNRYYRNDASATLAEWLEQSRADVIALQELASTGELERLRGSMSSYPYVYARLGPRSDVAILSRWPIVAADMIELTPGGSHATRTVVRWNDQAITILGVHLHWPLGPRMFRLRNAELKSLAEISRTIEGPLLVGGDLNITPWSPLFRKALSRAGLQDCARGRGLLATWPSWLGPAGIRIDHCMASDEWRVASVAVGPGLGSDHRVTINDLQLLK